LGTLRLIKARGSHQDQYYLDYYSDSSSCISASYVPLSSSPQISIEQDLPAPNPDTTLHSLNITLPDDGICGWYFELFE
jgi:hypothetical protein